MTHKPTIVTEENPIFQPATKFRRWRRLPWIVPLMIIVVAFIAFSLPPYLTLDPGNSRIPPPDGVTFYYPFLVAHVMFAAVAMITSCFLIWSRFRERYPAAHQIIGRVYVFGGVIPAGIIGLMIGAMSPFGFVLRVSNVLLAVLWLIFTITGFQMARHNRFREHQRWMIRSFALTMSVISNRIWAVILLIILMPQLNTTFEGNEKWMVQTVAGLSGWLGWVIPLLVAEWWLERRNTVLFRRR